MGDTFTKKAFADCPKFKCSGVPSVLTCSTGQSHLEECGTRRGGHEPHVTEEGLWVGPPSCPEGSGKLPSGGAGSLPTLADVLRRSCIKHHMGYQLDSFPLELFRREGNRS